MSSSVSIVITTFNDAKNLELTLASVREQLGIDSSDVEVVVSDGGSTDNTGSVLSDYLDVVTIADSRPDGGVYDGMNLGAALATREWLHFLNAGDTFINPTCLMTWKRAVESSTSEFAWVTSGAIHLHSHAMPPSRIRNLPHSWWRHALGVQPHCHQATWFRRSAFETLGGYAVNRGFAGDFDLILRAGLISRPLEIPAPLVYYLGGGMSELGAKRIPSLLHAIRVERMGLGPAAAAVDLTVAKAIGLTTTVRGRIGFTRRRFARLLRRSRRE